MQKYFILVAWLLFFSIIQARTEFHYWGNQIKNPHIPCLVSEGFCLGNIPEREQTKVDNSKNSDY